VSQQGSSICKATLVLNISSRLVLQFLAPTFFQGVRLRFPLSYSKFLEFFIWRAAITEINRAIEHSHTRTLFGRVHQPTFITLALLRYTIMIIRKLFSMIPVFWFPINDTSWWTRPLAQLWYIRIYYDIIYFKPEFRGFYWWHFWFCFWLRFSVL